MRRCSRWTRVRSAGWAVRRFGGRFLPSAAVLAWLAGCATSPAPPPAARQAPPAASASGPDAGTRVGSTASGGSIVVHETPAPAVADSTPSPEALEVLGTIPEPLGGRSAPESTEVPVPSPTEPLGDRSRATTTLPDAPASPPAAPPPAVAPAAAASSSDSCWRVQVAAPPDRERAHRMAQVAQSQLGVPFVIEHEGGLDKVRTRDCFSAGTAAALRNRAVASGFDGSFRFLRPKS